MGNEKGGDFQRVSTQGRKVLIFEGAKRNLQEDKKVKEKKKKMESRF